MVDDGRRLAQAVGHTGKLPEHLRPFTDFLGDFNKESDRGAVLSAAAYVDDLLGKTISAFLLPGKSAEELVEEYPGGLSTFSARIMAAHALGLVSDAEKAECTAIRKVRNEFAHAVRMSFDDPKVDGLCSGLKFSVGSVGDVRPNARMRFTSAAVSLIAALLNRAHYVGEARLTYGNWPR